MRLVAPILLLALLCGCETTDNPAPTPTATAAVAGRADWGDLPTFEHQIPVRAVPPHYPVEAKQAGQTGTVIVAALVDEGGKVLDVKLASSSGIPSLDDAALHAVRQWRYAPAAGVPRHITLQPISFNLQSF